MNSKRLIRDNLLHQLKLVEEHLIMLYGLEEEGYDCKAQIDRHEEEANKLRQGLINIE